ncbi:MULTISPECIES: hypothetical protein [Rhodomicrobium]|uniref:hypothetical protein n=1 Tax=Rhodomicrobium TaxID=1068 RepID=UPI000B4B6E3B|nr:MULTISPECIES: hypothetical protein [Rhodomicrobium]
MFNDFSADLQEARIAIEAAIATAGIVAQTDLIECESFNQLVIYLHDAVEALSKAESAPAKPQHTIFPTQEAANDFLAAIEPGADVAYRLSRSGDGRCVVQVFRLAGLL